MGKKKDSKVFYLDTETTGISAEKYEIIQLAGIVEVNNVVEKEFSFDIKAQHPDVYEQKALDTHGIGLEKLQLGFEHPEVHSALTKLLEKYVDRYDKFDKFFPAGYNVRFDVDHLREFFRRNKDDFYGSWFNWNLIDGLSMVNQLVWLGKLSLPNYQLGTVCEHFEVSLKDKHKALEDIRATRLLIRKLRDIFKKGVDNV